MSVTDYVVLGGVAVIMLASTVVVAATAMIVAKACTAFTVAIGQAQQLGIVGIATREEINMRRGQAAAAEVDEEEPNRPARTSLLEDYTPADLMAAARQMAERSGRGERSGRRPPREHNANENAATGGGGSDIESFEPEASSQNGRMA